MKTVSYRSLLVLSAALVLAGGCSNPNNPNRDVVAKPPTPEQKQALQTRLQNDPTLHGRFHGAAQHGAAPGGPAHSPPWIKPVTHAGP